MLHGIWDLSSPPSDWTCAPFIIGSVVLTSWPPGKPLSGRFLRLMTQRRIPAMEEKWKSAVSWIHSREKREAVFKGLLETKSFQLCFFSKVVLFCFFLKYFTYLGCCWVFPAVHRLLLWRFPCCRAQAPGPGGFRSCARA